MKATLFFSPHCPDTAPFVAELERLGVEYEPADILGSMANLKRFLVLRDSSPEFISRKLQGYIGIPVLLLDSGKVIFEPVELSYLK